MKWHRHNSSYVAELLHNSWVITSTQVIVLISLVQKACIEKALEGKDIVARAHTGSGKTLAYVLPALHKLLALPPERQSMPWQVLILVPTRELSEQVSLQACSSHTALQLPYTDKLAGRGALLQVKEETESLVSAGGLNIRVTALTATGAAQRDQFLRVGPVVVATPGRIAQASSFQTLISNLV